jgi:hypothetical protein
MSRKPGAKPDPFEREIEQALAPGEFIPDRECHEFVDALREIAARIGLLAQTDSDRAIVLHETFLAACHAKAEELDDSSGSFGQFVVNLFCEWIRARQKAGADADQTAARLLKWMDDDPYGFCDGLEEDAARIFDKAGKAAFVRLIRERFDAAGSARADDGAPISEREKRIRQHWGGMLRALYRSSRNITAYRALAEETGITAKDCHTIAVLLVPRRKFDDALAWIERGMDLDREAPFGLSSDYELTSLKREILVKVGRRGDAIESVWADFQKNPGAFTYDHLMKFVPRADRAQWHEKAMEAAGNANLRNLMELLLETGELERLADLIRRSTDDELRDVSHCWTAPAAGKLEKSFPDLAARLWRAQAMRIVVAKKSKYYRAALSNFESAMRCYKRAGLVDEWEKTVRNVREDHHRKTSFISGFERLIAGRGPSQEPTFMERAKARWSARHEEADGET